jgi:N-acetylglutamate synthase-like GNAT family acetyltransferase
MLNRFMMDTWLLWGPSIPLCTCSRWQGGIALQFGYGDENNSLPVFIPYSERKSVLRKMEAQQMALIRPLENPHCQALGSRVVFTGVPIWCESLDGRELASAQSSLRDPEKSGLLLEYVTHEEKASPGSQDSAGYYSAYIWLMLEVTRSSRWSGGPPSPDQPWLRLIPIYEHANLFDHAAFTFFKKRLAEKAVQFLEHERNSDLEFQCRLACAIDDTGCASEPIHAFPGPSISYYMQEILDRKEHAELRTRIDLRRPSGGSTMSACHIPGWVGQLEKHVSPEEAFPHAGSEFEPHEFGDGRADRRLLSRLYRDLYEKEFPDPDERESLENILDYLGKKRSGWYERNNYHVLALLKEGNPVAVSICDYFAEPNAGVIEFLAIHPGWRKQGLGAKILKMTEQVLEQDALRAGNELSVILAEMEDPYKTDPPDADPPGTGMDASARAKIWGKWGFFRLNFPYVQPSLGKGKQAVTHLLLLAKRMKGEDPAASGALWESEKSMQAAGLRIALKAYMRWAMRIDKPEEEDAYKFMSNQLSRSPDVPLVSLDDYLEKAHGRMKLRECLAAGDGAFNASMRIYEEAFAGKAQTAIPRQEFTKQLEKQGKRKERQERDKERDDKPGSCAYHLCAVSDPAKPDAGSIGMVSFFTFPGFGFGGYLALSRDQRHQGRLAGLICAVEDSMLRDRMGAKGWFIECDPEDGAAPWFEKRGFHQVPFTYRQPRLPGSKEGDGRPLLLLYKEFGPDLDGPPPLLRAEAVRGFLVHLGNEVYGLEKTEATSWSQALHDECHLKWKDTASPSWAVPFKPRQGQ